MELSNALADLARDHGTALFRDADGFRAALDDYLDEGTATSGTINLLTDAVRLGALDGMVSMLDSGAGPEAAVESAGQRLARERGSTDTRGCQWACAILGYALGRVPEPLVRSLDPGTSSWPSSAPSTPPAPQSPPPPPAMSPPAGFAASPPQAFPQQSPPAQFPAQAPTYGAWQGQPQPPKKSRTGLIIGLCVLVLVLVVGGVVTAVLLAGNGDDKPTKHHSTSVALDGPKISGTGYTMSLPSDWTDGTADFSDSGSTLDKVALWGQSQSTARANVIVEVSSAEGESDPEGLESQWKAALTSDDATANLTDIDGRDIDGEKAIGTDIVRVNSHGVTVHQTAYLVVHDTTAYSITVSFKDGDAGVEPEFTKILDAWKWD